MRFAISKATGDPSPAFFEYLRGVHRDGEPRLATQAQLLLGILGIDLSGEDKTESATDEPRSSRQSD